MSHCYERIQSIASVDEVLKESQADSSNGCLQVAAIPQLMMPCSDYVHIHCSSQWVDGNCDWMLLCYL